jgi:hypothetical protein
MNRGPYPRHEDATQGEELTPFGYCSHCKRETKKRFKRELPTSKCDHPPIACQQRLIFVDQEGLEFIKTKIQGRIDHTSFFVLNFLFDIVNGVGGLDIQSDCLSS